MLETTAPAPQGRYFPETGCTVAGAFLDFFHHYGVGMCGLPLTERLVENGTPTQYFQRLALEEIAPHEVRVKPLGTEVLQRRGGQVQAPVPQAADALIGAPPFAMTSLVTRLPRHPSLRYESRSLDQIDHLVIHHSAVAPEVGPDVIAGYHVTDLNWPGIGYHFVVYPDGHVAQTNALTTTTYHARQFNTSGVGIALLGNFDAMPPTVAQMEGAASVCAWLRRELGLPLEAIQGHRELVNVTCPGRQWLDGAAWKYELLYRVRLMLGEARARPDAPVAPTLEAADLAAQEAPTEPLPELSSPMAGGSRLAPEDGRQAPDDRLEPSGPDISPHDQDAPFRRPMSDSEYNANGVATDAADESVSTANDRQP